MTTWQPSPPARKGLLVAEIAALVLTTVVESVMEVRAPATQGALSVLFINLVPAVGPAVAVLAVLRRRFPRHIGRLGAAVVALSLVSTGASVLISVTGAGSRAWPAATEVVAMALMVSAGCRRLSWRAATGLALAGGAAMVASPLVRYGIGSPAALFAVPTAVLWGAALAVGLILRDADTRRLGELAEVRAGERLQLARELHDLVAHYVSGIVVRAQAARSLATNPAAPEQDPVEVYTEIEDAGAEALTAMRRLVGMLRTSEPEVPFASTSLGEAVREAVDDQATVDIPDGIADMLVPPELSATVNRVVLEALTNARRHAPDATEVLVTARVESGLLVLDVVNDGVTPRQPDRSGTGYGLIGMTERLSALGGTLRTGPESGHRWRITARMPLEPGRILSDGTPGGV
jgi:signal transduction histidine kinase